MKWSLPSSVILLKSLQAGYRSRGGVVASITLKTNLSKDLHMYLKQIGNGVVVLFLPKPFNLMAMPGEHILHSGVQLHGLTSRALDEPWILVFYLSNILGGAFLQTGIALSSHTESLYPSLFRSSLCFSILGPHD